MLTVCALVVALTLATLLAVISIKRVGTDTSDQILLLLCETGQKNLNVYFDSVEQSVKTINEYAKEDLEKTPLDEIGAHIERVEKFFEKTAVNTMGILTYYYRIDPDISVKEKGFWYVNTDGNGFVPHEVTDISQYDTDDQSSLVWFTVPKATGGSIWLSPYITENLNAYVLSYNVPVYKSGSFIGVIGIEIDYNTIVQPVNNITLYKNGYAFINDKDGNIIYHPHLNVANYTGENKPVVPAGLLSESRYIRYEYEGIEKTAVWMPLHNGMRLNVTVPVSEINGDWIKLINRLVGVSALMLIVSALIAARYSSRITTPLRKLAEAAEQVNTGNYDFKLDYKENNEVGILTRKFSELSSHLKTYITNLNNLAYFDALTSVQNKGAFDLYTKELQSRIDSSENKPEFAVGVFDCDNLKKINDCYGHDKGNIYLKNASLLICQVFSRSPVFRTGGDEFAVVLQNDDYNTRSELAALFNKKSADHNTLITEPWRQVKVTMGLAAYDPHTDNSIDDVIRRADLIMYQNKRENKTSRQDDAAE